jgi:hypothetical protein
MTLQPDNKMATTDVLTIICWTHKNVKYFYFHKLAFFLVNLSLCTVQIFSYDGEFTPVSLCEHVSSQKLAYFVCEIYTNVI